MSCIKHALTNENYLMRRKQILTLNIFWPSCLQILGTEMKVQNLNVAVVNTETAAMVCKPLDEKAASYM